MSGRAEWKLLHPPNTAVFVPQRLIDNKGPLVNLIFDHDGDFQALDGLPVSATKGEVVGIDHILEWQPDTLRGFTLLESHGPGHEVKIDTEGKWHVQLIKRESFLKGLFKK